MIHLRRLTARDRAQIAYMLRELADVFDTDRGHRLQDALTTAAAVGFPRRASTVPAQPGGPAPRPDDDDPVALTPVEAAAIDPDRVAITAQGDIDDIDRMLNTLGRALSIARAWSPTRPVAICQRCGHPLERGSTRCRRVDPDTGEPCIGTTRPEKCRNPNCGAKLEVGKIRDGRCPACARCWSRHGQERIPTKALALGDNLIPAQGETTT